MYSLATIRRKRSVFWIPKDTDTQSQYVILLSRYTNVFTNAPQHYVIRTPSVLFPHHLINGTIKKVIKRKMYFDLFYNFLSETFLILGRNERGTI
jgi:hypothetical protein